MEMLQDGSWRNKTFKPFNLDALGSQQPAGILHPLLKVRACVCVRAWCCWPGTQRMILISAFCCRISSPLALQNKTATDAIRPLYNIPPSPKGPFHSPKALSMLPRPYPCSSPPPFLSPLLPPSPYPPPSPPLHRTPKQRKILPGGGHSREYYLPGGPPACLQVRREYRELFLELGFEEMPTSRYVESSFWNFDALFQPQQHPARDAHDTFFVKDPATSSNFPEDYLQRVQATHENGGGTGSIG